ncbi:MAG: phage tail protein [Fluviicola sp.]
MLPERFLPLGYRFLVYFEFNPQDTKPATFEAGVDRVVDSFKTDPRNSYDLMFQSVSGLSVDIETEEYAEGGENRFKHTLPVRTKYPNLVLKRGLAPSSAATKWIKDAVEKFQFKPANLTIILQNDLLVPLHVWSINHAIPVKWSVDAFNAEESKIVIETLELKYNYFSTKNPEDLGVDVKGLIP